MLERPNFPDESIIACLQVIYGLQVAHIAFLPLGGDLNTAVYRVTTQNQSEYFCKLRRGVFNEATVTLPKFLWEQGVTQIIPPLATQTGRLWVVLGEFNLILYPFVEGTEGYEVELTERRWADFGLALKQIHTLIIPPSIASHIPHENYSSEWREKCQNIFQRLHVEMFTDTLILEMLGVLQEKREMILKAVERAEQLAQAMAARPREFVLCHCDLHPGNLFIDPQGSLFIVDWDEPLLAPKERDLMFIGGGQGFKPYIAEQEERLFYQGYGHSTLDTLALAYYRYERGITDISVECERVLSPTLSQQDRKQALEILKLYLLPGGTLEMAQRTEQARIV